MEFHEKLQELRKYRGLTQEELAQALYVSRTAVSKWESGRGYPNIVSLKAIAEYFSVSVDELLSGEKLLSIAEKENNANLRSMCTLLFGMTDICALLMMILPLYPHAADGRIFSVNLFAYTDAALLNRLAYWVCMASLAAVGLGKIVLLRCRHEKGQRELTDLSMGMGSVLVLILAVSREAYAIALSFILLLIKGMLLFKSAKADI